jgi:hypothetical protein
MNKEYKTLKKLLLVPLLWIVASFATQAQTYTQMLWGLNTSTTPYNVGADIGGTLSNFANVSSAGVWTVPSIEVAPTFESLGLVPNSPAAAVANCNAINALIDQANNSNKKVIVLPGGRLPNGSKATIYVGCSIDLKYSGITLTSPANDDYHNRPPVNAPAQIAAVGMTTPIIKMRSPYGPTNTRMTGIHVSNLVIDGSGSTAPAIDVDSIAASSIKHVYILNSAAQTLAAMYFHTGVEGVDLGETTTIQNFVTENVDFRQLDGAAAQNTSCVRIDGSSNANFSVNQYVEFTCVHFNAPAYVINSADNVFFYLRTSRGAGGTGATLVCGGPTAAVPVGCDGNTFQYIAGAGSVIFQGTDTAGVTGPTRNQVFWYDKGNGTPDPTIGTGSTVDWTSNIGWRSSFPFTKTAIADSGAAARVCGGRVTFESLRICNGSASQLIMDDGGLGPVAANAFTLRLNSGTFELLNLAGGGGLKFGPPTEFVNPVTMSSFLKLKAYTVATLTASLPCVALREGYVAYVTDATAPTYNGALVGGGTVKVPVFCDGTAWTSH